MQVDKCDICGKLTAVLQTCRLCKRRVCEEHFEPHDGMCSQCHGRLGLTTQTAREASISGVALKLFFVGLFLMFAGVLVLVVAALLGGDASMSGAVVIVVWFIPIIVGVGPYAFFAVLIAAILTIVAFVVFVWMRKHASKAEA